MTIKNSIKILMLFTTICMLCFGCKKSFLDAKPSTDIVIPATLSDLQQLIDYGLVSKVPALPIMACDDYYLLTEADWASLFTSTERGSYIWDRDIYGGEVNRPDWNQPYSSIFYANSVLKSLESIPLTEKNTPEYNFVKGQAYFARAFTYFELVKSFAAPFDLQTADEDLGLPLKLSPNIDEIRPRATVLETYNQIIGDLTKAKDLLSPVITLSRNRGNKIAAYALFSRLYLSMRQYSKAELYADSCLELYNKLIDYNTVNQTTTTPFPNSNDEVIFWSTQVTGYTTGISNSTANISVDTTLIRSYATDDLRRSIYFATNGSLIKFKRGYSANSNPFAGLATDEIYLIKAECMARRNETSGAMTVLNNLLIKRFVSGKFVPYVATSMSDALNKVLAERRKELVWRAGLRWDDLRRLNKEGANIVLTRRLNNKIFTLPSNDPKYIFPIPDDEISLSGIQQNIR